MDKSVVEVVGTITAGHDRSRYEGKNLLRLLLAFGIPALVLYLRLALALAASARGVSPHQAAWLNRGSFAVLAIFFIVELFCARYVQQLLRPASSRFKEALQYAGVLLMCLFFSVSGAISLEAFGYETFLRVGQNRH